MRWRGANIQFRLASVSERRINPVRQHISNWTCSLSQIELVMVQKFQLTFGYKLKYKTGINPAASQNRRRPFRQYNQGATAKVNCSTARNRYAGTPHLHSKCKGQAPEPLCVPWIATLVRKRAPHAKWTNEIEKTAVFSSIFFTYVKVRLPVVQFLRRVGVV